MNGHQHQQHTNHQMADPYSSAASALGKRRSQLPPPRVFGGRAPLRTEGPSSSSTTTASNNNVNGEPSSKLAKHPTADESGAKTASTNFVAKRPRGVATASLLRPPTGSQYQRQTNHQPQQQQQQPTTKSIEIDESDHWRGLIGSRVQVGGEKLGTLLFYGATQFADGIWCGVRLEEPVGKNDGTVNGVRYFTCSPNCGIFAPPHKIGLLPPPSPTEPLWTTSCGSSSTASLPVDCPVSGNGHTNYQFPMATSMPNESNGTSGNTTYRQLPMTFSSPSSLPAHSSPYSARRLASRGSLEEIAVSAGGAINGISYLVGGSRGSSPGTPLESRHTFVVSPSDSSSPLEPRTMAPMFADHHQDSFNGAPATNPRSLVTNTNTNSTFLFPVDSMNDTVVLNSARSTYQLPFEQLKRTSALDATRIVPDLHVQTEQVDAATLGGNGALTTTTTDQSTFSSYWTGASGYAEVSVTSDDPTNTDDDYSAADDGVAHHRQGSLDLDESLGILTPDQMRDFTVAPDADLLQTPSDEGIQELVEDEVADTQPTTCRVYQPLLAENNQHYQTAKDELYLPLRPESKHSLQHSDSGTLTRDTTESSTVSSTVSSETPGVAGAGFASQWTPTSVNPGFEHGIGSEETPAHRPNESHFEIRDDYGMTIRRVTRVGSDDAAFSPTSVAPNRALLNAILGAAAATRLEQQQTDAPGVRTPANQTGLISNDNTPACDGTRLNFTNILAHGFASSSRAGCQTLDAVSPAVDEFAAVSELSFVTSGLRDFVAELPDSVVPPISPSTELVPNIAPASTMNDSAAAMNLATQVQDTVLQPRSPEGATLEVLEPSIGHSPRDDGIVVPDVFDVIAGQQSSPNDGLGLAESEVDGRRPNALDLISHQVDSRVTAESPATDLPVPAFNATVVLAPATSAETELSLIDTPNVALYNKSHSTVLLIKHQDQQLDTQKTSTPMFRADLSRKINRRLTGGANNSPYEAVASGATCSYDKRAKNFSFNVSRISINETGDSLPSSRIDDSVDQLNCDLDVIAEKGGGQFSLGSDGSVEAVYVSDRQEQPAQHLVGVILEQSTSDKGKTVNNVVRDESLPCSTAAVNHLYVSDKVEQISQSTNLNELHISDKVLTVNPGISNESLRCSTALVNSLYVTDKVEHIAQQTTLNELCISNKVRTVNSEANGESLSYSTALDSNLFVADKVEQTTQSTVFNELCVSNKVGGEVLAVHATIEPELTALDECVLQFVPEQVSEKSGGCGGGAAAAGAGSGMAASTTSIETGYQGDAECDLQSEMGTNAANTPVDDGGSSKEFKDFGRHHNSGKSGPDPGSDSDFFSDMGASWTESELDGDERFAGSAVKGRGARVIDGRLYYRSGSCSKDADFSSLSNESLSTDERHRTATVNNTVDHKSALSTSNATTVAASSIPSDMSANQADVITTKIDAEQTVIGNATTSADTSINNDVTLVRTEDNARSAGVDMITDDPNRTYDSPANVTLKNASHLVNNDITTNIDICTPNDTCKLTGNAGLPVTIASTTASSERGSPTSDESNRISLPPSATQSRSGKTRSTSVSKSSSKSDNTPGSIKSGAKSKQSSPEKSGGKKGVESSQAQVAAARRVKTPKKNVMSKIKAMIEATSNKLSHRESPPTAAAAPPSPRTPLIGGEKASRTPKKSRWDAVMSKIAAGQESEKSKNKREVISKVNSNLTPGRPANAPTVNSASPAAASTVASRSPRPETGAIPKKRVMPAPKAVSKFGAKFSYKAENTAVAAATTTPVASKRRPTASVSGYSDLGDISINSRSEKSSSLMSNKASKLPRSVSRPTTLSLGPPEADSRSSSQASILSAGSRHSTLSQLTLASHTSTRPPQDASLASLCSNLSMPEDSRGASTSASNPGRTNIGRVPVQRAGLKASASAAVTSSRQSASGLPPARASSAKYTRLEPMRAPKTLSGTSSNGLVKSGPQPDLLHSSSVNRNNNIVTREVSRLEILCEARTKELNYVKMQLKHCALGFDSLSVLVQYLSHELGAFSVPGLKAELLQVQTKLELTNEQLDQANVTQTCLREELSKCQEDHKIALELVKNEMLDNLKENEGRLNGIHHQQIQQLTMSHQTEKEELNLQYENKVTSLTEKHKESEIAWRRNLDDELENLKVEHAQEITVLRQSYDDKLICAKAEHDSAEKKYETRIAELSAECEELTKKNNSIHEILISDGDPKLLAANSYCEKLEKEVSSLKSVLEMQQSDLKESWTQKALMEKVTEDLSTANTKIKKLQAKNEDLQAMVVMKVEIERELKNENQKLKEGFEKGAKLVKRVSMENEGLQWRLRQSREFPPSFNVTDGSVVDGCPGKNNQTSYYWDHEGLSADNSPRSNFSPIHMQGSPGAFSRSAPASTNHHHHSAHSSRSESPITGVHSSIRPLRSTPLNGGTPHLGRPLSVPNHHTTNRKMTSQSQHSRSPAPPTISLSDDESSTDWATPSTAVVLRNKSRRRAKIQPIGGANFTKSAPPSMSSSLVVDATSGSTCPQLPAENDSKIAAEDGGRVGGGDSVNGDERRLASASETFEEIWKSMQCRPFTPDSPSSSDRMMLAGSSDDVGCDVDDDDDYAKEELDEELELEEELEDDNLVEEMCFSLSESKSTRSTTRITSHQHSDDHVHHHTDNNDFRADVAGGGSQELIIRECETDETVVIATTPSDLQDITEENSVSTSGHEHLPDNNNTATESSAPYETTVLHSMAETDGGSSAGGSPGTSPKKTTTTLVIVYRKSRHSPDSSRGSSPAPQLSETPASSDDSGDSSMTSSAESSPRTSPPLGHSPEFGTESSSAVSSDQAAGTLATTNKALQLLENSLFAGIHSPRVSAGEAMMVLEGRSSTSSCSSSREQPASLLCDPAHALLKRALQDQLSSCGSSCCDGGGGFASGSSFRGSVESCATRGEPDSPPAGLSSKPDTPESSQAVMPTDSTNIDLSWSDEDLPSETEV